MGENIRIEIDDPDRPDYDDWPFEEFRLMPGTKVFEEGWEELSPEEEEDLRRALNFQFCILLRHLPSGALSRWIEEDLEPEIVMQLVKRRRVPDGKSFLVPRRAGESLQAKQESSGRGRVIPRGERS